MTGLSYLHGAGGTPLIGETIGVSFDQAVERFDERDAPDRLPVETHLGAAARKHQTPRRGPRNARRDRSSASTEVVELKSIADF
jgi:hypothetical protein